MAEIVGVYTIDEDDIDLEYWNQPDILESVDREGEPFESIGDVVQHITDGLNNQQFDIQILDDNGIDYSVDWEYNG